MEFLQLLVLAILSNFVSAQSVTPTEVVWIPRKGRRGGWGSSVVQCDVFKLRDEMILHLRANRFMVWRSLGDAKGHGEENVGYLPEAIPLLIGVEDLEAFVVLNKHFIRSREIALSPSLWLCVLSEDVGLSPLSLFSHGDERWKKTKKNGGKKGVQMKINGFFEEPLGFGKGVFRISFSFKKDIGFLLLAFTSLLAPALFQVDTMSHLPCHLPCRFLSTKLVWSLTAHHR